MSKEAGFLETIVQDSKGVGNNTLSASKKDELKTVPSLFDTMLKDVSTVNTTQDTTINAEKTVSAQEAPKSVNTTSQFASTTPLTTQVKVDKEAPIEVISDKNNVSPLSLLDRLISEVSEQIKNDDLLSIPKIETVQNVVVPETALEDVKNIGGKNLLSTAEQPVSEESIINGKSSIVSAEVMNPKLDTSNIEPLLEAEQSNEVTSANSTVSTPIKETVLLENNSEIIDEIKEIQKTQEVLPTKPAVEAVITPSGPIVDANTSVSLLDKLINDANLQIQKEATLVTTVPVQSLQTVVLVEGIESVDVKQIDSVKSIQNENKAVVEETKILKTVEMVENTIDGIEDVKVTTTLAQTKVETPLASSTPEKVVQDLSKVTEIVNEKTSLTKDQIENVKSGIKESTIDNKDTTKSLLDKLIDETNDTIQAQDENLITKTQVATANAKIPTDPILTNIYLSSVNKTSKDAFLEKNQEVKTLVSNATSVKDVQKGADLLNLGLEKTEVVLAEEEFKENVKNDFLNKLSINRDIIKQDIVKMNDEINVQNNLLKKEITITTMAEALASKNLPEVEVSVSSANAYNIENRIIGARQQMGSMMSDLARNMYLNYKPPVTAFRMNLNPGNLGSIAVLIKHDKDNGLSISLNMSNVATLDSIVDNQGALRAALAKNFNTNANINLEFNMQEGKQQGNGSNQQNKRQQHNNHRATNDILESLSHKNESDKVTNYM